MKPQQDPPRLLDPGSDAPAWLRASMEAGARDLASPPRLARIAARLPLGPMPAPPAPPAPGAGSAIPSVLQGAAVGAALGLAVVGAGWLASPRAPASPAAVLPVPHAIVSTRVPEPPPLAPLSSAAPRRAVPTERAERRPGGTASPAPSAELEPAPPDPRPSTTTEPEPPAAEPENVLLARAQDALAGSPAQALALTDLHLARFPGGRLTQEREILAVDALLRMGRGADARARATRFVTSFPTSPGRRRLQVLIPDLAISSTVNKNPGDAPSTP